jgi:hypothetical protein
LSTTEQNTQSRIYAAQAAQVYTDLAQAVLSCQLLEAPAMRENAARIRAEGDDSTAVKFDDVAKQMELDPLGHLLGRTSFGMLSTPPEWPLTPREFRPSGRAEELVLTDRKAIVELLARLDAEQYPDVEES